MWLCCGVSEEAPRHLIRPIKKKQLSPSDRVSPTWGFLVDRFLHLLLVGINIGEEEAVI